LFIVVCLLVDAGLGINLLHRFVNQFISDL